MALAWGEVGTFMTRWYGSGVITSKAFNILPPAPEPLVFDPLSIPDCALWLDANDSSTLQINEDTSGVNLNRVMKWFDKAKPSNTNYYVHDGSPSNSGLYNVHTMNQLNTVYFEPNAYMQNHQDIVFNFQARTFFAVIKPLTDISGALNPYINIYNTLTPQGMNTGIAYDSLSGNHIYSMCENGITCGIQFDLSNNPVNQRMIMMFAQTDQIDLSGNAGAYDTAYKSLLTSDPADAYFTGESRYELNNSVFGTSQDIAEILMYGRLLTTQEQTQVMDYLADKWNLSGPNNNSTIYLARQTVPYSGPLGVGGLAISYTYIIYGVFDGGFPNWFWCDENAQVESPAVLADGYDGTTALRDGIPTVVSGVFYA